MVTPVGGIRHRSGKPRATEAVEAGAQAIWHPSPNHGPRRDGLTPQYVVLHYTAMIDAQAALQRLCDPEFQVSAHYLIGRDGTLWLMVPEHLRAWHAGAGEWAGNTDINSRSIGIELDNRGDHPFPARQMACLEHILRGIMHRWSIPPEGVIGHSDMAPGRKWDPGQHFDWTRLARQGLAAPSGSAHHVSSFSKAARQAGFTADVDEKTLLAAVRLRHRPWGRGRLCDKDLSSLPKSLLPLA
ncbi:MAG: N-acetylmuramoyl-L-alanine amidase [Paracoccaceae bacterium]